MTGNQSASMASPDAGTVSPVSPLTSRSRLRFSGVKATASGSPTSAYTTRCSIASPRRNRAPVQPVIAAGPSSCSENSPERAVPPRGVPLSVTSTVTIASSCLAVTVGATT